MKHLKQLKHTFATYGGEVGTGQFWPSGWKSAVSSDPRAPPAPALCLWVPLGSAGYDPRCPGTCAQPLSVGAAAKHLDGAGLGKRLGRHCRTEWGGGVVGLSFAAASGRERETERWVGWDGVGRFFFLEKGWQGRVGSHFRMNVGGQMPVSKYFCFYLHETKQNKERLARNKECLNAVFFNGLDQVTMGQFVF
jgi:hypothetical protein